MVAIKERKYLHSESIFKLLFALSRSHEFGQLLE